MGNLPPHMLDQIRQAQERAQVTDKEVQSGPSKKARLAFLQAAKASDSSNHLPQQIDPSLANMICYFCHKNMTPTNKTDTRAAKVSLPCRHAYHLDCLCAKWYEVFSREHEEKGSKPLATYQTEDTPGECVCCHQFLEQQREFVAAQVPPLSSNDSKLPAKSEQSPSTTIASILESEDPSMRDILLDIRCKLWDSNHKVVSAALRMLVQIIHSDIESDDESEKDDQDSEDDEEKEDYSDLVLSIGLPIVLVYCMTRHGASHADIPKMVIGVFEWLVSREEVACRILPRMNDALLRIVESMQQNSNDGSLQYMSLQVLNKILTDETRLTLNSAGIIGATFQAMLNNKENVLVQESALSFLDNFTNESTFAIQAVAGHDQTLRDRHAQCLAGSLLCISHDAKNDPSAIEACGRLIIRVAQSDTDFRAAIHKFAGAPIKQVFVNFGSNAEIKELYRNVLRCLVSKPSTAAATKPDVNEDDRKMPAKTSLQWQQEGRRPSETPNEGTSCESKKGS